MNRDSEKVIGFQFEPIRRKTKPSTDSDSSWESCYDDDEETTPAKRSGDPVDSWCKCGKGTEMATEAECFCCSELESANFFDLEGECHNF